MNTRRLSATATIIMPWGLGSINSLKWKPMQIEKNAIDNFLVF